MQKINRVVVVGGGMIGMASAHYLRQAGLEVTVIDQGTVGSACSHGNCGLISPSHIFPLCGPGVRWQGLKAMLQSNAPLKIKPRWDLSLWRWLFQFSQHCNLTDMIETGHARSAILNSSRELYAELIESAAFDCDWEAKGCLFVFKTEAAFEEHRHKVELMNREYGAVFKPYVQQELEKLEPAFIPGSAYGAWYYPEDAHLRPSKLVQAWKKMLLQEEVTIREHCTFQSFLAEGSRTRGVLTDQGELEADAVIVALGAVTPFLNKHLGYQVPIQPGKGYSITMTRPQVCPSYPMILEKEKVAITPMQSGYRVGSTMEFAGYDTTLNRNRLELLKRGASNYLREPMGEQIEEEWYGWRPMTPDGKAIIDYSPKFKNVLVAAGHNMLGISMAPATGKLVAEILTDQPRHIDPVPFQYPRKKRSSGNKVAESSRKQKAEIG